MTEVFPTLEHLLGAGEAVTSLQTHEGWHRVHDLIDAEVAAVQRGLDEGAYKFSHAELAWAHGRLSGLKALKGAADAIVERAETRRLEQANKHESADAAREG